AKNTTPGLYFQKSPNSKFNILVHPKDISRKDHIFIKQHWVSKNSELLAYAFLRNGSDWTEIKVVSLKSGKHKKDHLQGIKYSGIAWRDDGFYYSTFHQDDKFSQSIQQKVFYHKLGTKQEEDKLIFERKNRPYVHFYFKSIGNERFFILIEENELENKTNIFYIDFEKGHELLRPLVMDVKGHLHVIGSHEGKLIITTSKDSNAGRVVLIDPEDPYNWKAISPEYKNAVLLSTITCEDRIVTAYQVQQVTLIIIFDYQGNVIHTTKLPLARSIGKFSRSNNEDELYFYYFSFTIPPVSFKLNIKNFEIEPMNRTTVTFDFEDIIYEELEYKSKDSVTVPMVIVYEKGIKLDGSNPVLLKAYGGFGHITQNNFDPGIVHFIKKGGIYAFANIRGGGDKGEEWSKAGRGKFKQNSFDDFIAAAEFLIREKFTNPEKLAISGGSNGGLVVAAAAIQRPDLFKAVVPVVSPFDMLRFENFTIGHKHTDEYGTISDSLSFLRLLDYSPYHNVSDSINYPSMLIITSENDDRVPPLHSYKFVARMQNRSIQKNPILLKVEEQSGHYGALTHTSRIKSKADLYGFIMNEIMD
ncbi:MAG: prolyl oligopeptidase family serine peptidase, partial [Bacteroidota bacterium]